MDDVRWQVGETFFLYQQGATARYTARFIGYIKNRGRMLSAYFHQAEVERN